MQRGDDKAKMLMVLRPLLDHLEKRKTERLQLETMRTVISTLNQRAVHFVFGKEGFPARNEYETTTPSFCTIGKYIRTNKQKALWDLVKNQVLQRDEEGFWKGSISSVMSCWLKYWELTESVSGIGDGVPSGDDLTELIKSNVSQVRKVEMLRLVKVIQVLEELETAVQQD